MPSQKKNPYGKIKFKTIDDYHQQFDGVILKRLNEIRKTIKSAAPNAEEVISYNMPAFRKNKVLVYYAAAKEHIGFYPTPNPIKVFQKDLLNYKTSKGAIQFPLDRSIPSGLVKKIVGFRIKEVESKAKPK